MLRYPSHIPTSAIQKLVLSFGSAVGALNNLYRDDLIGTLGETTGTCAMKLAHHQMKNCSEGRLILKEQPSMSDGSVSFDKLKQLPKNSFGNEYYRFCIKNKITPVSRKPVHFVDDADLAYVMKRYRDVHDITHSIMGMPTTLLGETAVKVFESHHYKLPMATLGGLGGLLRMSSSKRALFFSEYLPFIQEQLETNSFLLNFYFEMRWEQDADDLRNELGIKSFNS